jgi:hypothetical protein
MALETVRLTLSLPSIFKSERPHLVDTVEKLGSVEDLLSFLRQPFARFLFDLLRTSKLILLKVDSFIPTLSVME